MQVSPLGYHSRQWKSSEKAGAFADHGSWKTSSEITRIEADDTHDHRQGEANRPAKVFREKNMTKWYQVIPSDPVSLKQIWMQKFRTVSMTEISSFARILTGSWNIDSIPLSKTIQLAADANSDSMGLNWLHPSHARPSQSCCVPSWLATRLGISGGATDDDATD